MPEKRLAIHAAPRGPTYPNVTICQIDNSKLVGIVYGTRQDRWLLGNDVTHYLDSEMYKKALDLQSLISEEENLTGDAQAANV